MLNLDIECEFEYWVWILNLNVEYEYWILVLSLNVEFVYLILNLSTEFEWWIWIFFIAECGIFCRIRSSLGVSEWSLVGIIEGTIIVLIEVWF